MRLANYNKKPNVGDTVFVVGKTVPEGRLCEVTKSTSRFFWVDIGFTQARFSNCTWSTTTHMCNLMRLQAHPNVAKYMDQVEHERLCRRLASFVTSRAKDRPTVSLQQLEQACKVLGVKQDESTRLGS